MAPLKKTAGRREGCSSLVEEADEGEERARATWPCRLGEQVDGEDEGDVPRASLPRKPAREEEGGACPSLKNI